MGNSDDTLAVDLESLEKKSVELLVSKNIKNDSSSTALKPYLSKDRFEIGYKAIESAIPDQQKIKTYAFPHPRQWMNPRLFAIWIFPILFIKQTTRFLHSIYIYMCE